MPNSIGTAPDYWKRYATTNPVFIWMVMKEYFKKKWK